LRGSVEPTLGRSTRRKSLRLRVGAPLAIAAGVAIGVAAAIVLRAERRLGAEPSKVLAAVSDSLGHRVQAEQIEISYWPPGVVATGVHVSDESPFGPGSLLRADELELRASPWDLLRGRLVVDEVRLVRPAVRLVRGDDGSWNTESRRPATRRHAHRGTARGPSVEVEIDTVRVRSGRIRYRDRAVPSAAEVEVEDLNLLARRDVDLFVDFNASALGGGPESLTGGIRIPPLGHGSRVEVELHGSALEAPRVPEFLSLLQIPLPFAADLGGHLDLSLRGQLAPVWPTSGGRIEIHLGGRDATLNAASGWLVKPPGVPADLTIALERRGAAWAVDQAALETTGIRLVARVDALAAAPGGSGEGSPPLRFSAESIRAEDLAAWVPPLASLEPSGEVFLDGRLEPDGEDVIADVGLTGGPLELRGGRIPVLVQQSAVRVRAEEGDLRGSATLANASFGVFSTANLRIDVEGRPGSELALRAAATEFGREGARLEGLAFAGTLGEGRLSISWIDAGGFGGTLAGRASVVRFPTDYVATIEPQWQGVDAGALLRLIGVEPRLGGIFSGRATLFTRGTDLFEAAERVGGEFEAHLGDGILVGVNPGRALLDDLRQLPGLRGIVERRAAEHAPELLASSAPVQSLYARGLIADGNVEIETLALAARAYHVEAAGRVSFGGQVDLDGRIGLAPEVRRALLPRASLLGLLSPLQELSVPLAVRGVYPDLVATAQAPARGSGGKRRGVLDRLLGGRR
jgi:hypothetical protein